MFERGAFAGATPEQSYQVVTDSSVNTPESVDAGRFIAQIQVAPSQPLEFITVLLTRISEDMLQAREA
jgi:phage tail sheath protein FI